jgi:hypothetical protein
LAVGAGDAGQPGCRDNLLNSHRATFGTFNENRHTGALERFLTPLNARTLTVVARRRFGGAVPDGP